MEPAPESNPINPSPSSWQITPERAFHAERPLCIGILNITPDSFADGGAYNTISAACDRAQSMIDQGADALDIGGESTRPGASRVDADEQIRRVVPIIESIRNHGINVPITIDTTRADVARAALDAGADAINDVSGATDDAAILDLASQRHCGLILMHRVVAPEQDQYSDQYALPPMVGDSVDEVVRSLSAGAARAMNAGVAPRAIMIDPGLGFGKTVEQNLALIRNTSKLTKLGYPVLSALSKKSFVGRISLGRDSDPSERLWGTIALSVLHLSAGARYFRVHDVGPHRQALDAAWANLKSSYSQDENNDLTG